MKKNTMMRVASALLVAVLLTTCAISGTFAKYTTSADAADSARVAKWGVVVEAEGNDAFAKNYADETGDNGVQVKSDVKVVAPGTAGDLAAISIEGSPEVVVDVDVNATLTLEGWEVNGALYCPIVFTIGSDTFEIGATYADIDALTDAIEAKFDELDKTAVQVGTALDNDIAISWAWDFNGDDESDTALGNIDAANLPTIEFACDVTVTQVD